MYALHAWLYQYRSYVMLIILVLVLLVVGTFLIFTKQETSPSQPEHEPVMADRTQYTDLSFLFSIIFVLFTAFFVLSIGALWPNILLRTAIGLYFGFYVFLFIFPMIPGLLERLANDPEEHPENPRYGFFVFLQQGRVIVIQRGNRFFRAVMDYAGHMWFGERLNPLVPRQPAYWDVEPSGEVLEPILADYPDSHPIPFPVKSLDDALRRWWWLLYFPLSINWWVWKRYAYDVFGAVFTGLYWFQGPLVYRMLYYKKTKNDKNEDTLVPTDNWSNHFRVSEFQFHIIVPNADTQDQAQVKIGVTFILRVFNPHMAAYRSDGDWAGRVTSAASAAITQFTRSRPMSELQAAANEVQARQLAQYLTTIGDRSAEVTPTLCAIGMEIMDVQIFDISPSTPGLEESFSALAKAKVQRQADEELAKGKAAYVREEGAAMQAHPNSEIVVQTEGLIRAAEAAGRGGGIVILGGGAIDPMQAAILAQLKKGGT